MESMTVRSLGDDRYAVRVRGHELIVDQPAEADGAELGPTPVELFVAGLASCVAHYAGSYLARHHIARDDLRADVSWQLAADRPARVANVTIRITPPPGLPPGRLPALLAVARACTVHNSLEQPPMVSVDVTVPPAAVA